MKTSRLLLWRRSSVEISFCRSVLHATNKVLYIFYHLVYPGSGTEYFPDAHLLEGGKIALGYDTAQDNRDCFN